MRPWVPGLKRGAWPSAAVVFQLGRAEPITDLRSFSLHDLFRTWVFQYIIWLWLFHITVKTSHPIKKSSSCCNKKEGGDHVANLVQPSGLQNYHKSWTNGMAMNILIMIKSLYMGVCSVTDNDIWTVRQIWSTHKSKVQSESQMKKLLHDFLCRTRYLSLPI